MGADEGPLCGSLFIGVKGAPTTGSTCAHDTVIDISDHERMIHQMTKKKKIRKVLFL